MRGDAPGFAVPLWLIVALAVSSASVAFLAARLALAARGRPVVSGREDMLDAPGSVFEADGGEGWALVRGERWRVHAPQPLHPGDRVRVVGMRGLTLEVVAAPNDQTGR
jgi:membrane-bound serine protease (ClpP class)